MKWEVIVERNAARRLLRFPRREQSRISAALIAMGDDPFSGDVVKLRGEHGFRRRVGSYRILFDINLVERRVEVTDIMRRTSTTY